MDFIATQPWLMAAMVFVARVGDVSLATLRTILIFRGQRLLAATIGFFEVLVWLFAVATVLPRLDLERWYLVLAYASGFATGNIVGIWIEAKLALGHVLVRTISANPDVDLGESLRSKSFSVVEVPGTTDHERKVEVLFLVERRRRVPDLMRHIEEADPGAVTTMSDVKEHRMAMDSKAARPPWSRWIDSVKRK